jgi:hypothetical protein
LPPAAPPAGGGIRGTAHSPVLCTVPKVDNERLTCKIKLSHRRHAYSDRDAERPGSSSVSSFQLRAASESESRVRVRPGRPGAGGGRRPGESGLTDRTPGWPVNLNLSLNLKHATRRPRSPAAGGKCSSLPAYIQTARTTATPGTVTSESLQVLRFDDSDPRPRPPGLYPHYHWYYRRRSPPFFPH